MDKKPKFDYAIVLDDPEFVFTALHFLSFPESDERSKKYVVEPIHGHDFRVSVRIEGPLNDSDCVVDFLLVSDALKKILEELDHKLILAEEMNGVKSKSNDKGIVLSWTDANDEPVQWTAQYESCFMLSKAKNTSAEKIAEYILSRLLRELRDEYLLQYDVKEYYFKLRLEERPGSFAEVIY